MNASEEMTMLTAMADALEIDITPDGPCRIKGSRKAVMEVFEGYSPTVVSSVFDSIIDSSAGIIGVCIQVWGNLNIMCINDRHAQLLTLFVYDRTKVTKESPPFGAFWSRRHTYKWLEGCTKGIYSRSIYDTVWTKLESGTQRLSSYNYNRSHDISAGAACDEMWNGGLPK